MERLHSTLLGKRADMPISAARLAIYKLNQTILQQALISAFMVTSIRIVTIYRLLMAKNSRRAQFADVRAEAGQEHPM